MTGPSFEHEQRMQKTYGPFIAGVDEVGRGPLSGPVLAAAAIILDQVAFAYDFAEVNDSKKLTSLKRGKLFERLTCCPFVIFAIGQASVEEIDRFNIRQATLLAMRRALRGLREKHELSAYLVDGNVIPYGASFFNREVIDDEDRTELKSTNRNERPGEFLIRGDAQSVSIATASILAKVTRDRLMKNLAREYPGYGWERNVGYGTAEHLAALQELGPTLYHRRSFAEDCFYKDKLLS